MHYFISFKMTGVLSNPTPDDIEGCLGEVCN